LLTRAADADDPAFATALEHEDERVRALASLLQQRLRTGTRSYANFQGFGAQQPRPEASPSSDPSASAPSP